MKMELFIVLYHLLKEYKNKRFIIRMEWYTRDMIWKPASPEQINSVTNYLTTNQATQKIGLFKE